MQVLLTFTGSHDPYSKSSVTGELRSGPVLAIVGERHWDRVFLLTTPKMEAQSTATREAIQRHASDVEVEIINVPLADPTNYIGILRQLRKRFREIDQKSPGAEYSVCVSSGTPHMHASWLLLVASGEIPAKILQVNPPEFVKEGKSCLKEIDFSCDEFPMITRPPEFVASTDEGDQEIIAACREIGIVGSDPALHKALNDARICACYPETHVLLLGETGAGKEFFSRFIHRLSPLGDRPLTVVNCSSIPENLFESQLFGHKRGAFTGATHDHEGKFSVADRGILFLDEIGELPLGTQAKLLRALEQGEIEPLGANRPLKVRVQVVAATNRDLRQMVADQQFRADLYQRFSATIQIPSLRQRKGDIPNLAIHLLERWNTKYGKQRRFAPEALRALTQQSWPGNVRELKRVVDLSAMFCPRATIKADDLRMDEPLSASGFPIPEPDPGFQLNKYLNVLKHKIVERALEKADGVQARGARMLGWSPQALNQYLKSRKDQ